MYVSVKERKSIFADWQVDKEMMNEADKDAVFMHCLPAHRGQEVTSEVLDSEYSLALQQAENRMHAQNAVLVSLFS